MPKKIAVLIGDRQEEALRMSLGLTQVNEIVDVYVLDRKLERVDSAVSHFDMMKKMDMTIYSNLADDEDLECLSTDDIARRLVEYDHVLPY